MSTYSRNHVSLNIQGTQGAEYYDQICAISQETINKNFKVLFKQRPEIVELWYKDLRGNGGILDAILDPPQVKLQIGSADLPELYFEIHIKSGTIKISEQIQCIDNWVITVRSQLFDSQISQHPYQTSEESEAAAAQMEEVKKSYDVSKVEAAIKQAQEAALKEAQEGRTSTALRAGDYSIQRLFCVIAQGNWATPVESYSYLPDPNDKTKRISITDWRASNLDSKTRYMATAVSKLLGNWAEDNQESAFWNLGIQVRLPVDNVTDELKNATCAPTAVRLQNYAYISSAAQEAFVKEQQNGATPITTLAELGHPQNCLVFCETVNRNLPSGSRLDYGGNLAEPATGSDNSGIPGTFILDHRLYFERKILRYLRELCVKTSVIPLYPKMFTDHNRQQQFQSRYIVGGSPTDPADYPGLPEQTASNPTFDFVWEAPGRYAWHRTYPAPGSDIEVKTYTDCDFAPVYRKWRINSKNAVEVTWTSGGDTILVKGTVEYNHWEAYNRTGSMNFNWGSENYDCYYGMFKINVSWSFQIDLCDKNADPKTKKQANGVFQPVITGLDQNTGLPLNLSVIGSGGDYVKDQTDKNMRNKVEESLREGLNSIGQNIRDSVQDAGQFIYPGTRTLVFEDPKINDYGDILATIDYMDLEAGLVTVNAPVPKEIKDDPTKKVDPVIHDSTVTGLPTHVTWNPKIKYDSVNKRAALILEGRNNLLDPMAFEDIAIQFLPTGGKDCLFKASAYNWKSKSEVEEKERIARQTKEAEDREKVAQAKTGSNAHIPPAATNGAGSGTNDTTNTDTTPVSTWQFAQHAISEELQVTIDQQRNSLIFHIQPTPPLKSSKKQPRFTVPPGGYFSLTLDGEVSGLGDYILQLDETWNSTDYKQSMPGKRSASAFLRCMLIEGAEGKAFLTSQEDADKVRGVKTA